MHTGAYCDVNWTAEGKQLGHISFPYSIDRSPYYQIKLPICRIKNGEGPGLLLMAGNHGDEYEGELTLLKAMRLLEPADIHGSITILPIANQPAVMAARRNSPLDGGNLNRSFPGDPAGQPTQRIAHYIEHDLLPLHDAVFDIHSGGTSMDHLVCSLVELSHDEARDRRAIELMQAMRLPYGFVADNGADSPTSMAAARRAGIIGLSGELGGGATVTPSTMAYTARAVDNLLRAMGITGRPLLIGAADAAGTETELIRQGPQSYFVYADRRGWFEPAAGTGDLVEAGQIAGWRYDLEAPLAPPDVLTFKQSGIVVSKRLHTPIESGDCLFSVAERSPR